jgi:ubiquinone/menaquinone biosynthesis C-methylase UbiE
MGLYRSLFLPWLIDKGTSHDSLLDLRSDLVAQARGRVLEIGFGPGGSVLHYDGIDRLFALEPEPGMLRRARTRLRAAKFPIHVVRGRAEKLPFPDQTFDTVVSVFGLCSVQSVSRVLRELQRVLRPEGSYLFLEHGRAHDFYTAQWQRRLDPVQRRLFGCHVDLAIDRLVMDSGLRLDHLERVLMSDGPVLTATLYRGVARHEEATTALVSSLRAASERPMIVDHAPAALAR